MNVEEFSHQQLRFVGVIGQLPLQLHLEGVCGLVGVFDERPLQLGGGFRRPDSTTRNEQRIEVSRRTFSDQLRSSIRGLAAATQIYCHDGIVPRRLLAGGGGGGA